MLGTNAIFVDTAGLTETSAATGKVMEAVEEGQQTTWQAIENLATEAIKGGSANQLGITGEDFTKKIKSLVEYANVLTAAIDKTGVKFEAVDEAGARAAMGKE